MAARMVKTKMPGVYRRGSRYVVTWEHRGKQRKESFRTYAEAREAKARRQGGERRPTSRIKFEDHFREWIESYAGRTARGFSETSRRLYRRSIEDHALDPWGTWRLADVEPADERGLLRELREAGYSTSTIKGVRAALSAMYATAVEDGLVRSSPIQGVRIPGADEEPDDERAKALTTKELRLILAALPEGWRPFFEFLAHTGLRISEAIGLRWENVDLGTRPMLKVREQVNNGTRKRLKSKDGRRDVPLSPGMAERLRARRRDRYRGEKSPVWTTEAGTELSRPNLAGRVLKPAARAAGLTVERDGKQVAWPSFHTFRHTCASALFAEGRNVKQVAGWLGHADPAYTLRTYVHLMDDGIGDADFLDRITVWGGKEVARGEPQTGSDADPAAVAETAA